MREVELCTEFIPVDRKADELQNQAVKSRLPSFCNDMNAKTSITTPTIALARSNKELQNPHTQQHDELDA